MFYIIISSFVRLRYVIVLLIAFTLVVKIAIAVVMGPTDPVVVDLMMLIVSVITIVVMLNVVILIIVRIIYNLAALWLILILFVIGPVRV